MSGSFRNGKKTASGGFRPPKNSLNNREGYRKNVEPRRSSFERDTTPMAGVSGRVLKLDKQLHEMHNNVWHYNNETIAETAKVSWTQLGLIKSFQHICATHWVCGACVKKIAENNPEGSEGHHVDDDTGDEWYDERPGYELITVQTEEVEKGGGVEKKIKGEMSRLFCSKDLGINEPDGAQVICGHRVCMREGCCLILQYEDEPGHFSEPNNQFVPFRPGEGGNWNMPYIHHRMAAYTAEQSRLARKRKRDEAAGQLATQLANKTQKLDVGE